MKRFIPFGVLAALGVMLGCPLYGGDGHGNGNCSSSTQCPIGETCNPQNTCQQGDCTQTGCVSGSTCTIENGNAICVANTTGDSGTDAGPHPYSGCFADTDCAIAGTGSKCLNAQCTTPPNQCADLTQCGLNEQCVQGVCTPTCSGTMTCPTGFSCDSNSECTGNPTACTVPGGACGSNGICIEQHCVAQCGTGDKCSNGLVCVNGGCMPNQLPSFTCTTEGVQAECATGSICLRHNCYISCAANPNACQTASEFNVCKTVTTTSGSYQVCGSSTNLGSDCDPTIGKNCPANGVCIDGYCH
jgi:hypothetical protein